MIRIAIVEDELQASERLEHFLKCLEQERNEKFAITVLRNAEEFLEKNRQGFELVLMDIELPGMNGMEAAERMRKMDSEAVLVFVTNMAQYAVKGYEVNALDFIVKPVKYADFTFKMKRALYAVEGLMEHELVIPVSGGMRRISVSRLLYVEVNGHKVQYHLIDQVIETRSTLKQIEKQLSEYSFLRCNNCYLVNPRHVKWAQGHTVQVGREELQISHPRKKSFLQGLGMWITKGGQ